MLYTFGKLFFGICKLRLKPQDVPPLTELLLLCLLAYAGSCYFLSVTTQSAIIALFSALVNTASLSFLTYMLVALWRVPERWLQVTTALAGTGVIFNLLALPLYLLLANLPEGHSFLLLVFLLVIILVVWNISVMAHIMRHALEASFAFGILLSLLYVLLITYILSHFQPAVV